MYARKIFAILGSVAAIFVTTAFSFQSRVPFTGSAETTGTLAGADVLQSVDGTLNGLNKRVHSRMPANAKVEILRETLSSIESLRKQNPVQTVDKEIYMDFSTESLEPLASDREFSVKKCPEYKARVMNDFEPYAENRPTHPALKRSYEIIEGICS